MNTSIDREVASGYVSRSQIARVCTEAWGAENLYCTSCGASSLERSPHNRRAVDFACGSCQSVYQLKSGSKLGNRIVDAAHSAMIEAIRSSNTPNLLYLHYNKDWRVQNLLLVPSFFFAESCIKPRPPLPPTARRAGWVGCEILLGRIAAAGKIWLVREGNVEAIQSVRDRYDAVRPIASISTQLRGWTLDVLNVVHKIGQASFTLDELYAFEDELAALHPNNMNVRPKIRQQLQVLRDTGLLDFEAPGEYRLR